jgi:hypothetical protein
MTTLSFCTSRFRSISSTPKGSQRHNDNDNDNNGWILSISSSFDKKMFTKLKE